VGPAETSRLCYKITPRYGTLEYLLIENRQPMGFDSGIPHGGLAIWQIDENRSGNAPNNEEGYPGQPGWPGNGKHFSIALLQADGRYDLEHNVAGDSTDLFRPPAFDHIDETTVPSTLTYQAAREESGNQIDRIQYITESIMSFRYRPGVWVDFAYGGTEYGTFSAPYRTLSAAETGSATDWMIICKAGTTSERPTLTMPRFVKTWHGVTTVGY
jgi:hypothetical protein